MKKWLVYSLATMVAVMISVPWVKAQDSRDQEIKDLKARVERLEADANKNKTTTQPNVVTEPAATVADPQAGQAELPTLQELVNRTQFLSFVKDWNWGGNMAVSYNWNFDNPESHVNQGRFFDDRPNHFNINQFALWVEKPTIDESPVGFGAEIFIGRDAKKTHSFGLGNDDNPVDLLQAYVLAKIPVGTGIELKAGKFYGFSGYESCRASESDYISFGMLSGLTTPSSLTGIMATYVPVDELSLTLGLVNGQDQVEDRNDDKSLVWSLNFSYEKLFSLSFSGMYGAEQDNRNAEKLAMMDVIVEFTPTPELTIALNFNHGEEQSAVTTVAGLKQRAEWYTVAGYLKYVFMEKLASAIRAEYMVDEKGYIWGYTSPVTADPTRLAAWSVTWDLRYQVVEHFFVTFEYRHDHSRYGAQLFDNRDSTKAKKEYMDTIAFQLIYQF